MLQEVCGCAGHLLQPPAGRGGVQGPPSHSALQEPLPIAQPLPHGGGSRPSGILRVVGDTLEILLERCREGFVVGVVSEVEREWLESGT